MTFYLKESRRNQKEKHDKDAKHGWYRYDVRFAIPVYENDVLIRYNVLEQDYLLIMLKTGRNICMIF